VPGKVPWRLPEIKAVLFGKGVAFSDFWIYNESEIPWDQPWHRKIDLK
jgi:hypothetical protein